MYCIICLRIPDIFWIIKYYSYDKNTTPNDEGIHTKTLKVDTSNPLTTDNAPSGWQTSSVTVTLTSTDATSGANKIYYTKDGSTQQYHHRSTHRQSFLLQMVIEL